ncbi:hypothetical protein D3C76_845780 [compost metagenome]
MQAGYLANPKAEAGQQGEDHLVGGAPQRRARVVLQCLGMDQQLSDGLGREQERQPPGRLRLRFGLYRGRREQLLADDPVEQSSHMAQQVVVAAWVGAMAGDQEGLQASSIDRLNAVDALFIQEPVEQTQLAVFVGELASHGPLGAQVLFDVRCEGAVKAIPVSSHNTSSAVAMTSSRSLCSATLP